MRDSITLTVHYDTPLDFSESVVIGLSQSGQTPDVVEYLVRARRERRLHDRDHERPRSELAAAAEATIPLEAGPELAVAATKTYVDTLGALVLLAGHVAGQGPRHRGRRSAGGGAAGRGAPRVRARDAARSRCRSRTPAGCS